MSQMMVMSVLLITGSMLCSTYPFVYIFVTVYVDIPMEMLSNLVVAIKLLLILRNKHRHNTPKGIKREIE